MADTDNLTDEQKRIAALKAAQATKALEAKLAIVKETDSDDNGKLTRRELAKAGIDDYLNKLPDDQRAAASEQLQADYKVYKNNVSSESPRVQALRERFMAIINGLPSRIIETIRIAHSSEDKRKADEAKAAQARAEKQIDTENLAAQQAPTRTVLEMANGGRLSPEVEQVFRESLQRAGEVPAHVEKIMAELEVKYGIELRIKKPAPATAEQLKQQELMQTLAQYKLEPADFLNLATEQPKLTIDDLGKVLQQFEKQASTGKATPTGERPR